MVLRTLLLLTGRVPARRGVSLLDTRAARARVKQQSRSMMGEWDHHHPAQASKKLPRPP